MQPDLTVATAFCNVSNKDEFREVSNIWVTMLSARGHTMELLKKLIYLEVEWSTDAGTLFRGNKYNENSRKILRIVVWPLPLLERLQRWWERHI